MSQDMVWRFAGAALFAIGIALAWWSVGEATMAAHSGSAEVGYRFKSVVIAPVLGLVGLVYLVGGARGDTLMRASQTGRLTLRGWIVAGVGLALGAALLVWFKSHMASLGYVET